MWIVFATSKQQWNILTAAVTHWYIKTYKVNPPLT